MPFQIKNKSLFFQFYPLHLYLHIHTSLRHCSSFQPSISASLFPHHAFAQAHSSQLLRNFSKLNTTFFQNHSEGPDEIWLLSPLLLYNLQVTNETVFCLPPRTCSDFLISIYYRCQTTSGKVDKKMAKPCGFLCEPTLIHIWLSYLLCILEQVNLYLFI